MTAPLPTRAATMCQSAPTAGLSRLGPWPRTWSPETTLSRGHGKTFLFGIPVTARRTDACSTVRVSVAIASEIGTSSNEPNDYPAISADKHYLVFMSFATNFLTGAGNGNVMIYLAKTGF